MNLEKRLAALEAALSGHRRDDPRQTAMGRLLDALREALPDDPVEYIQHAHSRQPVYQPTHQWHSNKLRALADRIATGTDTDDDRRLLDSLPPDALGSISMTANELVTMLAQLEFYY